MNSNVISTLQPNMNIEWGGGEGGSLLILHKKSLIVPRFLAKIVEMQRRELELEKNQRLAEIAEQRLYHLNNYEL